MRTTENTAIEMAAAVPQDLGPIMAALDGKGWSYGLEDTGGWVMAVCVYLNDSHIVACTNDGVLSGMRTTLADWYCGTADDPIQSDDFATMTDLLAWISEAARKVSSR